MGEQPAEKDRLLMLAGKAIHAAHWHDEEGCNDPSDCGATVEDEAAAHAVLDLLQAHDGQTVTQYGVRPQIGDQAGRSLGPLSVDQIGRWNSRSMTAPPRLLIRTVVVHDPTDWREATDAEVDEWNRQMAIRVGGER